MNIHETKTFTYTTTADTAEGAGVDLEELAAAVELLESQCSVTSAHVPQDVRLSVARSATHAQVLVTGGMLPSGTILEGVLSTVSARP